MSRFFNSYFIICEGKSEIAYIQEFNRLLRANNVPSTLTPVQAGNGCFTELKNAYKQVKQDRKGDKNIAGFIIWADKDIYQRNDSHNGTKYDKKAASVPDFHFNIFNFEDFLTMHLPKTDMEKWHKICTDAGHFDLPMQADRYEPLLSGSVFSRYSKGTLPDGILTVESLANLRANQADLTVKFKSDFAVFLLGLLR